MLKLYLVGDRDADREAMRIAEVARSRLVLDLESGRFGLVAPHRRRARLIDFFDGVMATKNHASWQSARNHLVRYDRDGVRMDAVDAAWLGGLQRFLMDRVSPNTAALYFSKVKAALNEAVRRGYVVSNPADRVPAIRKVEPPVEFLEFGEVQSMAATPCRDDAVKRAYLFSCCTGLRVVDVRALRWRNVRGRRVHFEQRKTRDRRYLPLADQAVEYLGPRAGPDDAVFDLPRCQNTVNTVIREWAAAAGVDKHLTYHTSRHTFATLQLTFGTDIYTVSDLCGHKELRSTQIYARVVDAKREAAVERIPKFEPAVNRAHGPESLPPLYAGADDELSTPVEPPRSRTTTRRDGPQ